MSDAKQLGVVRSLEANADAALMLQHRALDQGRVFNQQRPQSGFIQRTLGLRQLTPGGTAFVQNAVDTQGITPAVDAGGVQAILAEIVKAELDAVGFEPICAPCVPYRSC